MLCDDIYLRPPLISLVGSVIVLEDLSIATLVTDIMRR